MTKQKPLNFNRSAPDLSLLNTDGEPVQLSSLWAAQPLLLSFTRHFGCTQCKEMLEELVAGKERILPACSACATRNGKPTRRMGWSAAACSKPF